MPVAANRSDYVIVVPNYEGFGASIGNYTLYGVSCCSIMSVFLFNYGLEVRSKQRPVLYQRLDVKASFPPKSGKPNPVHTLWGGTSPGTRPW
jgi:hypothetical protein